jgi:hypothetical protein
MEQRDSRCPYLLSSETTAKGTGLAKSAGKEDPVELDSSLKLSRDTEDVAYVGGACPSWRTPSVKYHCFGRLSTHPAIRRTSETDAV